MKLYDRYAKCVEKAENKRVVSITVRPVVHDCTGDLWITDISLQEGDCVTGYAYHTEGMLKKYNGDGAVEGKRFFNGIIRGTNTIIVPNQAETSTGMDIKLYPKDAMKAESIVVSTGMGAHKAVFLDKVKANDELELRASTRECLHNGRKSEKQGFFQYCAACDSKHTMSVEEGKSARIYVEFQEMQDGGNLI